MVTVLVSPPILPHPHYQGELSSTSLANSPTEVGIYSFLTHSSWLNYICTIREGLLGCPGKVQGHILPLAAAGEGQGQLCQSRKPQVNSSWCRCQGVREGRTYFPSYPCHHMADERPDLHSHVLETSSHVPSQTKSALLCCSVEV